MDKVGFKFVKMTARRRRPMITGMIATQIKNAERGGQEFTAQPLNRREIQNRQADTGAETSDWLRLPRPKTRLWGLSRTTWNELCETGAVKSITLRKRHAQRGIKLIFRPSAEAYLKSLMDGEKERKT